jgi:hypothetical protein
MFFRGRPCIARETCTENSSRVGSFNYVRHHSKMATSLECHAEAAEMDHGGGYSIGRSERQGADGRGVRAPVGHAPLDQEPNPPVFSRTATEGCGRGVCRRWGASCAQAGIRGSRALNWVLFERIRIPGATAGAQCARSNTGSTSAAWSTGVRREKLWMSSEESTSSFDGRAISATTKPWCETRGLFS